MQWIRHPVLWWSAVLLAMAAIFAVSSIPGQQLVWPRFRLSDKISHAFVYMVLAALIVLASRSSGLARPALIGLLLASAYGVSDELHQSMVPQRTASLADVLADCLGSILGVWLLRFVPFMKDARSEVTAEG